MAKIVQTRIEGGNEINTNLQISKLGIQATPGTQVEINNQTITIGTYGLWEIDLTGLGFYIEQIGVIGEGSALFDYINQDTSEQGD